MDPFVSIHRTERLPGLWRCVACSWVWDVNDPEARRQAEAHSVEAARELAEALDSPVLYETPTEVDDPVPRDRARDALRLITGGAWVLMLARGLWMLARGL